MQCCRTHQMSIHISFWIFIQCNTGAQVHVPKTLTNGFGLHTERGCYSQSNTHTKKMFKLALQQHSNKHVWVLYVEGSSLLFHSQFLLISHTAMNLRSHPQKQTGTTATVHLRLQPTMKCNGKQSLLLEMTWLICTLHSLRIQMSAVILCLMCQIPVVNWAQYIRPTLVSTSGKNYEV